MDGAEHHFKIRNLNVELDSSSLKANEIPPDSNFTEYIWVFNIPHSGNLKVTFSDHDPPSNELDNATAYLECKDSFFSKTPRLFLSKLQGGCFWLYSCLDRLAFFCFYTF